jgi:lipopolysaccharide/colanic/teichoic acid biosynthesis glycosyltransferase
MYPILKSVLDRVLALLGLLLLAPLGLLIAFAIVLDSKGPVFFVQDRLTRKGKRFRMYKFRSMRVNAEKQGTGLFNYENDDRVTRVGRVLRNTSVDEWPQLINVLKGEMALVGPRPPVWYELGDYDTLNEDYKKRFTVLPGITGLAQVSGRNEVSWPEKVRYDNAYVDGLKKKGWVLDLKIIFKTFVHIFETKAVYEQNTGETDEAVIARAHSDYLASIRKDDGKNPKEI